MVSSRRKFLIGGAAAFGAFGAFGGNRFSVESGAKGRGKPKLRFGVVSDIHVTRVGADEKIGGWGNNLTFRHTLEWFRSQNVDAVMIAGDLTDHGTIGQLEAVAEAWYAVFPGDRYPDGRPVEKVFVTGNHDWSGYTYGSFAARNFPDEKDLVRNIFRNDKSALWDRLFHEPYAPIYSKVVNGYTFIGSQWDSGTDAAGKGRAVYPFGRIKAWMAENGKKIDPSLPFFYVQHPHPKDTCYGPWAWGRDKGIVTKTFSRYPNAIAFSGHSHYSLTDERSVWQGAFTSVGTSSLRYTGLPYSERPFQGYENSVSGSGKSWKIDAHKLSGNLVGTGDCRQGMLWSVYDDCIVVMRREFLSGLDVGEDWVMPLPVAESRPFAFAERAKKFRAPEFAAAAKLAVTACEVKNRGGKSGDGKETIPSEAQSGFRVVAPSVVPDVNARLYAVEFTAEAKGGNKTVKTVLADGFNHSLKHRRAKSGQSCDFAKKETGEGEVIFTAVPLNCFGARGKSVSVRFDC